MSNKLVVKCGNFAVLVDLHVLPQGTSKDTSWFSDHEKEEVCTLLRDTIDSRVRQHIESRRQQGQVKLKEYTQAKPLFLKGNTFRIAAYFIKRWVNIRCVVKHQYRELYVFPDRLVVCASQLEPCPSTYDAQAIKAASKKEPSSSTSEYFAEHGESELNNILATTVKEQAVLRNIVKKNKAAKDADSGFSNDLKVCPGLGLVGSDKGNKTTILPSELASGEQAKHCINTPHNRLELPDLEVENDVNRRQPCGSSSQDKSQSAEWLQAQDLTKALSWICESALPEDKQTLRTSIMQHKRRRHSSEGKTEAACKKADLRDDIFLSQANTGPEAMENMSLALRILKYQKPSTDTGSPEVPIEQKCNPSTKSENGPSNKLKRQRIKK
ncbi:PREDICTED: protein SLX4IP [Nanorana parkeri]|uniref:protein SLX4IP n=1 Tax=Nanorana parkeri TaxID=125878 RepID=UPI0008546226|nr:PREDICTED: protein SLX4IP [Nanorana parkeri]